MKRVLDIYFDMTVRKIITLVELLLLAGVVYVTFVATYSAVWQTVFIVLFMLMIVDRLVTLYYQLLSMFKMTVTNRVAAHVLECYLGPIFRMPRRIASVIFAGYTLIVITQLDADAPLKFSVFALVVALLINYLIGLFLSHNMHRSSSSTRP